MKKHVIFIPGILDDIYRVQSTLMQCWWLSGFTPHTHAIPWAGGENFSTKYQRLLDKIDNLTLRGEKVYLVAASAGASAAIRVLADRRDKIAGLIYVCGKINNPQTVSDKTYQNNPAFKESLYGLSEVIEALNDLDKAKMVSAFSPADKTVPYEDTFIDGIVELRLPALSHGKAILYAISFGMLKLTRQFKVITANRL